MSRDLARIQLLRHLEVLEALRPFADPSNANAQPFNDAWTAALQAARKSAAEYAAAEETP